MADIPVYESTAETVVVVTANGQTTFAFDFLILFPEQMTVLHGRDDVETVLTYPADFSVSGLDEPNGGTVTLNVATLANDVITMRRVTPIERLNDWQNEGDYKAALVNREQDTMFMIMQELARDTGETDAELRDLEGKAAVFPGEYGGSKTLPVPSPGKGIIGNASGTGFVPSEFSERVLVDASERAVEAEGRSLAGADRSEAARDIAEGFASDIVSQGNVPIYSTWQGLSALTIPAGITVIRVNGYAAMDDGGGGTAVEIPIGSDPKPWHRLTNGGTRRWTWEPVNGEISAKQFGAGLGGADDTVACQNAVDFAAGRCKVRFTAGDYWINSEVNVMPFPWTGGVEIPSDSHIIIDAGAALREITNDQPKRQLLTVYGAERVTIEGPGSLYGDRHTHIYPNLFTNLTDLNSGNYRTKTGYDPDPFTPTLGMIAYVRDTGRGKYEYDGTSWVRIGDWPPLEYPTHEFGFGIAIWNSKHVYIEVGLIHGFTGDGIYFGEISSGPRPWPDYKTDFITVGRKTTISNCRRQGISGVKGNNFSCEATILDIGHRENMQDGTAPRSGIDLEAGGRNKTMGARISGKIFGTAGAAIHTYDSEDCIISGLITDKNISAGYGVNIILANNILFGGSITGINQRAALDFTYTQSGSTMTIVTAVPHGMPTGVIQYFAFLDPATGLQNYAGRFVVTSINSTTLQIDTPGFTSASGIGRASYTHNNIKAIDNIIYFGGIFIQGAEVFTEGNLIIDSQQSAAISTGQSTTRFESRADKIIDPINDGFWVTSADSGDIVDILVAGARGRAIRISSGDINVRRPKIRNSARGIVAQGGTFVGLYDVDIDISDYPQNTTNAIHVTNSVEKFYINGGVIFNDKSDMVVLVEAPGDVDDLAILDFTGRIGFRMAGANTAGNRVEGLKSISNRIETSTSRGVYFDAGADDARLLRATVRAKGAPFQTTIHISNAARVRATMCIHDGTIGANTTPGSESILNGNQPY